MRPSARQLRAIAKLTMEKRLEDIDSRILNAVQDGLPAVAEPYGKLASELSLSEELLIERLKTLKAKGIIRRMGAVLDSRSLGYVGALCAAKVAEPDIDRVAAVINSYVNVTHNYLRDDEYNMWFTLIAASKERLGAILDEIKERAGLERILFLPATKVFKINAKFDVD